MPRPYVGGGVLAWVAQVDPFTSVLLGPNGPGFPAPAPLFAPAGRSLMKGDRVEIVIDSGEGARTYEVTATRAGGASTSPTAAASSRSAR